MILSIISSGRVLIVVSFFFFQAEDGIRDLVRSRGLGDVYKRQARVLHEQLRHRRRQVRRHVDDRLQHPTQSRLEDLSLIHI